MFRIRNFFDSCRPYMIWIFEGWRWIVLGSFLIVLSLCVIVKPKALVFRYGGLVLQIVGFVFGMIDIYAVKKEYGVASIFSRFVGWLKKFPKYYKRSDYFDAETLRLACFVNDSLVYTPHDKQSSLEKDFERLEKFVLEVKEYVVKELGIVERKNFIIQNRLESNFSSVDSSIDEINEKIRGSSIRSMYSAEIGIICFFVGSILNALPEEIENIFNWFSSMTLSSCF